MNIFAIYTQNIPSIIIFTIGIVISSIALRRGVKKAILTFIAFLIFFIDSLLWPIVSIRLPFLIGPELPITELSKRIATIHNMHGIFLIAPWTLLLYSVWRNFQNNRQQVM
jgi:hypothetical protein